MSLTREKAHPLYVRKNVVPEIIGQCNRTMSDEVEPTSIFLSVNFLARFLNIFLLLSQASETF